MNANATRGKTRNMNNNTLKNLIRRMAALFSFRYDAIPQQFTRVTEKFDVIMELPYKRLQMAPLKVVKKDR